MRRTLALLAVATTIAALYPNSALADHSPDFHGNNHSSADTIGISAAPSGSGYHTLDAAGGVFTHGDARFFGSIPGLRQQGQQIGQADLVDLTSTADGGGYWLMDHVGGVFTFGNARFFGSIPGLRQQGQQIGRVDVVAVVPVPGGGGYWMLDAAGGIFTFGNAKFFGSLPGRGISARVIGMAATPDAKGYWIATSDGGIHTFGNAQFFGSASGRFPGATATGFAASPHGSGYWVAFDTGQVVAFPGAKTESLTSRTFKGTGDKAVGAFQLKDGLVIATLTHTGDSNFVVWLLDGNGSKQELLVNEIGDVDRYQTALNVDAGTYMLEVDADGPWSVNLDEPRPTSGSGLPSEHSGEKDVVIGPLEGAGTARVTYNYDGSSNFVIWLIDESGEKLELLVNEIGDTSGSSFGDFNGIRYLDVTGDEGRWTIKVG